MKRWTPAASSKEPSRQPAADSDKHRWVIEQYDALRPAGQAAIDDCLRALPRRKRVT